MIVGSVICVCFRSGRVFSAVVVSHIAVCIYKNGCFIAVVLCTGVVRGKTTIRCQLSRQDLLPGPIPDPSPLLLFQTADYFDQPLRGPLWLKQLLFGHAGPEVPAQVGLERARVHADAHGGDPLAAEVQVERADDLVERGLGRAVRVPAAEAVVRDGADARGDVDPLGERGRRRGGRGRGQEAGEVLDEQEVRDGVDAERVCDARGVEVCGAALGVEDAAGEERGVEVRGGARGVQRVRGLGDAVLGREVEAQEGEPRGVDVREGREDGGADGVGGAGAVRGDDGEGGCVEEVPGDGEREPAGRRGDEDKGACAHFAVGVSGCELGEGLSRRACHVRVR